MAPRRALGRQKPSDETARALTDLVGPLDALPPVGPGASEWGSFSFRRSREQAAGHRGATLAQHWDPVRSRTEGRPQTLSSGGQSACRKGAGEPELVASGCISDVLQRRLDPESKPQVVARAFGLVSNGIQTDGRGRKLPLGRRMLYVSSACQSRFPGNRQQASESVLGTVLPAGAGRLLSLTSPALHVRFRLSSDDIRWTA